MENSDLKKGRVYRAKRPRGALFPPVYNDRVILWLSQYNVQYDSPSIPIGRRYKTVSRDAFLKWAERDVTDELPPGKWADFPTAKPA